MASPPPAGSSQPYQNQQWQSQQGSQIPIDPALQSQGGPAPPMQNYYQYGQPGVYNNHYQSTAYQSPGPSASQGQPPPPVRAAAPQSQPAAGGSSSGIDTTDINTLKDAVGIAGVDLRAEAESLQRPSSPGAFAARYAQDRSRTQPTNPNFSTFYLHSYVQPIVAAHALNKTTQRVSEDTINYLALATRMRLEALVEKMIRAARHRERAVFDRVPGMYPSEGGAVDEDDDDDEKENDPNPMWSVTVRRDVAKQLAALEKVEREEEMRIRQARAAKAEAAALVASGATAEGGMDVNMDDDVEMTTLGFGPSQPSKKKRKKDDDVAGGSGSKRGGGGGKGEKGLGEDARKKMTNAVASQATGLNLKKKYAWMDVAASSPAPQKSKPTTVAEGPSGSAPAAPAAASSWARPYVPRTQSSLNANQDAEDGREQDNRLVITFRDAMFVVAGERGHGGGRGAALGYGML